VISAPMPSSRNVDGNQACGFLGVWTSAWRGKEWSSGLGYRKKDFEDATLFFLQPERFSNAQTIAAGARWSLHGTCGQKRFPRQKKGDEQLAPISVLLFLR